MILCPLFSLMQGCCCGGLWIIKKHTLVFVPRCTHSTTLPVSMERTVQPNQMIVFLSLLRTLRPLFFWAVLYGKWFRQDRILQPFTMKWMDFNLWIFPDLQKKGSWWCISHSSFPVYLLYAIHVLMQFSSLFIRTLDVTQLSPVS